MIELRRLTPDGWRIWRGLRLAALAEAPAAFGSRLADWQGADEERWRARLAIPGSVNLVALLAGQPVGMASGVPAGDGEAELISMWVSPAARGRGVGDRLVRAVAEWAIQGGASALRLAVAEDNHRAAALYRRNGFADTGEPANLEGARLERIMVKELRPRARAR